ncbi:hypothetical protein ACJX0J_034548, partial [Zea mays]
MLIAGDVLVKILWFECLQGLGVISAWASNTAVIYAESGIAHNLQGLIIMGSNILKTKMTYNLELR